MIFITIVLTDFPKRICLFFYSIYAVLYHYFMNVFTEGCNPVKMMMVVACLEASCL